MIKSICQKCGKKIPMGRTKYDVHVEVVSDFNGFLPDFTDEAKQMAEVLDEAEGLDEQALEDDVHREFSLILCRACMREVVGELREIAGEKPRSKTRSKMHLQ